MKYLIAGGLGLIGKALTTSLVESGHQVWILSRRNENKRIFQGYNIVHWDGLTPGEWVNLIDQVDIVINLTGETLARWPWTEKRKQRFWDSRTLPGKLLSEAVLRAKTPPSALIQMSGVNYYGVEDPCLATEDSLPGEDFLSRLSVAWEGATQDVENVGVRRVIVRTAIVLSKTGGLLRLMSLPVRLFFGGRLGNGEQYVPWIHIDDLVSAIIFLSTNESASGAYNLVAPDAVTNAQFYKVMARTLNRPYWFPVPSSLMRLILGELSVLVLKGREVIPKRLREERFSFKYEKIDTAIQNLFDCPEKETSSK